MKQTKNDWFIGKWVEGDSSVLIDISKTGNGFRCRVFDIRDGEEFVVSKIKLSGKTLSFETLVPSNQYRTRNKFTLVSKNRVIQELTFWEYWKRTKRAIPVKKKRPLRYNGNGLLKPKGSGATNTPLPAM